MMLRNLITTLALSAAPLAAAADAGAAFELAESHRLGTAADASASEALRLYGVAAEAGNAMAMLRQGEILLAGAAGVGKDTHRGEFLIQAAAEAGEPAAWRKLGEISEAAGNAADATPDRERHFAEARRLHLRAAEAGDLEGQLAIALLLESGKGGAKDGAAALRWLREAARGGLAAAMDEIGQRYQKGRGVEQDTMAALGWFLGAAERGSASAMTRLGLCYAEGTGVPQNFDNAGSWYAKACRQNYPPARFLIAGLFEHGHGTEEKPVLAFVNYSLAADGGFQPAVEARDALKAKLTADQLAEAEKSYREIISQSSAKPSP